MNSVFVDNVRLSSLKLNVHNPFLAIPSSSDIQPSEVFTEVTTTVRNIYGKPLSGKDIFITAISSGILKEVIVFYSNHIDQIKIESHNNYEGFFVKTDRNGNVSFFIQPKKSLTLELRLYAQFPGDDGLIAADHTIYIVDHAYQDLPNKLPVPIITGSSGGYLESNGYSKFEVQINGINDIEGAAFILFFVNGKYTKKSIPFQNAYSFNLPFAIFENEKTSDFSYVVIRQLGDIYPYKSMPISLTYMRKPNEPWSDVNRVYEPCVVYCSEGVSDDNIIKQYAIIDEPKIEHANSDNAGLFVKVVGTNDLNDTTKVSFGSEVILNLYITASEGVFNFSQSKLMPYISDEPGGSTASLIFPIPRDFVKNKSGENIILGELYMDYQIGTDLDPNVSYGKTWFAHIDTFPY